MGIVHLAENDFDNALLELEQANQQNPYNTYRQAMAYKGSGNQEKAGELLNRVINSNALNNMNLAFVRHKAGEMIET